jgi:hypothetical protein
LKSFMHLHIVHEKSYEITLNFMFKNIIDVKYKIVLSAIMNNT